MRRIVLFPFTTLVAVAASMWRSFEAVVSAGFDLESQTANGEARSSPGPCSGPFRPRTGRTARCDTSKLRQ